MVAAWQLQDPSPAIRFLRKDLLRNSIKLAAIERNVPPLARTLWAAGIADSVEGILLVTESSDRGWAELQTDCDDALCALLRCLKPGKTCTVVIQDHLRPGLLRCAPAMVQRSEQIALTARPQDLQSFPLEGDWRRLTPADEQLAAAFPERASCEPPLPVFLESAAASPDTHVAYGLVCDGCLIGYVTWNLQIDPVWEVAMIRVRADRQGNGLGKAILSRSTRDLFEAGRVPLYQPSVTNHASERTALAAGYREVYRTCTFQGIIE